MFSPLEQFDIGILLPIILSPSLLYHFNDITRIFLTDISFTNASLYLFLALVIYVSFFYLGLIKATFVPTRLQLVVEQSYSFIVSIIKQQAGVRGLRYFPIFFVIFFIVLFSNLIGLLPYAFTPTSHLVFTFTFALTCNIAFIIIGFRENGISFLNLFVPKGGPVWLFPIITIIEFVSYLLRTFSLSIRLFANMMAGHTLLHILSSFVTAFIKAGYLGFAFFPFVLVLAVMVLELGIAFIQAYVFVILLCIYLNDAFHPSH